MCMTAAAPLLMHCSLLGIWIPAPILAMINDKREYRALFPHPELTFKSREEKRQEYVEIIKSKEAYKIVQETIRQYGASRLPLSPPQTPRTCGMLPKRDYEHEAKAWRESLQSWMNLCKGSKACNR